MTRCPCGARVARANDLDLCALCWLAFLVVLAEVARRLRGRWRAVPVQAMGGWAPATADYGVTGSRMPETGEKYTWIGGNGKTQNPSWHGLIDPVMAIAKVGKKAAGRLLDGVEHNGLPVYWPSNVGMLAKDELTVLA